MRIRLLAGAGLLAAAMLLGPWGVPSGDPLRGVRAASAARGRADVQLVRLLAGADPEVRSRLGQVHDLKLLLLYGNVVLLRKGGDFAALLPIERVSGATDSLRYFYYVEHPRLLWLFPGPRERGIRTVPAGGALEFNTFRLLWWPEGPGGGWMYFPDAESTRNLKFSVVSGRTLDAADPRDTKYWVELGTAGEPGF